MADVWNPDRDVPLAALTTLGVGGPARWYATAGAPDDVARAHEWARRQDVPLLVLGGGSNLVIADRGVAALVVRQQMTGVTMRADGSDTLIAAGAGESWDGLVARVCADGLAGMECLSGIPGSVGGTPIQNVGAYGQDVSGVVEAVSVFDRIAGTPAVLPAAECGFGYRTSRFKTADAERFVVCGVTYRLHRSAPVVRYPDVQEELSRHSLDAPGVGDVRAAVLRVRRRKGMVLDPSDADTRSVGSFFTNPVLSLDGCERVASAAGAPPPQFVAGPAARKVPAAWLIERAGFQRGHIDGAAGISTRHTLAIVNRGGATAEDIIRLASTIKARVEDRFGVSLQPEPVLVGFDDDPRVAHLRRG